jgi:hypothetical protein
MISYFIQRSEEAAPEYPFVRKVLDGQTASGYIVNQHYLNELIGLYEWAIPLLDQTNEHWNYANDMVWKRLQPQHNWYYMVERLGRQGDSYSDNRMCFVAAEDINQGKM